MQGQLFGNFLCQEFGHKDQVEVEPFFVLTAVTS